VQLAANTSGDGDENDGSEECDVNQDSEGHIEALEEQDPSTSSSAGSSREWDPDADTGCGFAAPHIRRDTEHQREPATVVVPLDMQAEIGNARFESEPVIETARSEQGLSELEPCNGNAVVIPRSETTEDEQTGQSSCDMGFSAHGLAPDLQNFENGGNSLYEGNGNVWITPSLQSSDLQLGAKGTSNAPLDMLFVAAGLRGGDPMLAAPVRQSTEHGTNRNRFHGVTDWDDYSTSEETVEFEASWALA
jgi:hypothetical protein